MSPQSTPSEHPTLDENQTAPIPNDILVLIVIKLLSALEVVCRLTRGKTLQEFRDTEPLRHIVRVGLDVIVTSCARLPDSIPQTQPYVSYRKIKRICNLLRNVPYHIPDEIVWAVVVEQLPSVKLAISSVLDDVSAQLCKTDE